MSEQKHPVDTAVEYVIYAPIGFALEAKRALPTFVERGRAQVTMARMVGKFVVDNSQVQALVALGRFQEQAQARLVELGLVSAPSAVEPAPGAGASAGADRGEPAPQPNRGPAPAVHSSAAAADLAIADYDSLAASQVIPRLAGLGAAELEAVRAYEAAHRGRRTILGRIAQLEAG